MKFIIDNEQLENIHIIPFRDITAPLHDMHPDGVGSKDCTRYCYFPQMWQSVWWKIDNVMNKTVSQHRGQLLDMGPGPDSKNRF